MPGNFVFWDRVKDTSTSTGTGAFTVSGTAPTGYDTFSLRYAVGDRVPYAIEHATLDEWETGLGTYSASNEITRTDVYQSSNSDAAVNFTAGDKTVFVHLPATHGRRLTTRGIALALSGNQALL